MANFNYVFCKTIAWLSRKKIGREREREKLLRGHLLQNAICIVFLTAVASSHSNLAVSKQTLHLPLLGFSAKNNQSEADAERERKREAITIKRKWRLTTH